LGYERVDWDTIEDLLTDPARPVAGSPLAVRGRPAEISALSAQPIFRAGEIFTRHGSASERANTHDIGRILDKRAHRAQESERAAAQARFAAYSCFPDDAEILQDEESGPDSFLVGSVGFATSLRPTDLTRRIFYDRTLESHLWGLMEDVALRRSRHYFSSSIIRSSNQLTMQGEITDTGQVPCYVRATVDYSGWVGIGFGERSHSWSWEECAGWWGYGAWRVALSVLGVLGCSEALFVSHRLPLSPRHAAVELNLETRVASDAMAFDSRAQEEFCAARVTEVFQWGVDFGKVRFTPRKSLPILDLSSVRASLAKGRRL
jgi:hypothetical protein